MKIIITSCCFSNLVTLQQKIYLTTTQLSYFSLQTWTFVNKNFLNLLEHIPENEKKDFDFSFEHIRTNLLFKNVFIGTQKYLFYTNPEKKNQAIKKLKRLVI